jgi:hypothetical protein
MVVTADQAWKGARGGRFVGVDFRAALLDQTRDFGELIRSADPSTPVPTCPEWALKQLFRHVGRGNRWAAQIIADRRTDELDPRDVRDGRPPDDPDAGIERVSVESRSHPLPLAEGRTLHLHATDDDLGPSGEWTITSDKVDGVAWSHDHGKGDVALRGPAKDLLLAIVRRRTAAELGVEVFGDIAVWDSWLDHTPF